MENGFPWTSNDCIKNVWNCTPVRESEKAFDTDVIIYIKEQIGFAEFTDF